MVMMDTENARANNSPESILCACNPGLTVCSEPTCCTDSQTQTDSVKNVLLYLRFYIHVVEFYTALLSFLQLHLES